MDRVDGEASKLFTQLQDIGWGKLVQIMRKFNKVWVREFYTTLPIVNWNKVNPT